MQPFGGAKNNDQAPILQREKLVARPQRPPDPRDRGRENLGLARPAQPVANRLQRIKLHHEAAGLPPLPGPKGPIQRRDHLIGDRRLGVSRQGAAQKQRKKRQTRRKDQKLFMTKEKIGRKGQHGQEKPRLGLFHPPHPSLHLRHHGAPRKADNRPDIEGHIARMFLIGSLTLSRKLQRIVCICQIGSQPGKVEERRVGKV
jgi:hypothetical protein